MCGIAGIVSPNGRVDAGLLERMRDSLTHRGPDGCGVRISPDGTVGLAHRRLAIIDLSAGGQQPMQDAAGRVSITFNGEIYNFKELRAELEAVGHRFRSTSDTEVLLAAYREWDIDCVPHLTGQFAFAIYDEDRRRLLLARDRAGEKPLYYCREGDRLLFASELKALTADPRIARKLDRTSFEYFLAYGYVPSDRSILRGVHKLPQGHAATFDVARGTWHEWAYWQLPLTPDLACDSVEVLTKELERLLEDAVRRQLVADVPVGILLSGGIDSSLVTAMAARVATEPLRTFTVTFPGHRAHDEAPHARTVAEHFGTRHTELAGEPQSVETLVTLARQFDEPIGDSAIVPTYLVSRLIRSEATVALGGDGGDELFGGYWYYSWLLKQEHWRRRLPARVRGVVSAVAERMPLGMRGRNHLIGLSDGHARSIAHINLFFDHYTRQRLMQPGALAEDVPGCAPETRRAGLCAADAGLVRAAIEADFRTTLVDAYLVKVDRASMLTSLEVRAPWLDHRIIEFAYRRVPDHLRVTRDEYKILPRRLAQKLLPPALDLSRKQGFTMPIEAWFSGGWGTFIEDVLRQADTRFFNPAVLENLLAGQRKGRANTSRLFALTMFELWRREYDIDLFG